MGMVIAWALVRYRFPGRRLFDAIVDIPFALPTAVAGIALSSLFAQQGWLGAPLERTWSCYQFDDEACGTCDSCRLRVRAFDEAGLRDPIAYRTRIAR